MSTIDPAFAAQHAIHNAETTLLLQERIEQRGIPIKKDAWGYLATRAALDRVLPDLAAASDIAEVKPKGNPIAPGRRLFLTAGHGGIDRGAFGLGYWEADLALRLRDTVAGLLAGHQIWTDPNAWAVGETAGYLQRTSREGDIICDLHFNAATPVARGVEVIVPDEATGEEITLAQEIAQGIATVLDTPLRGNRGMKHESETPRRRLAMMRPAGANVLVEVCFLTSQSDMSAYHAYFDRVARSIANSLRAVL